MFLVPKYYSQVGLAVSVEISHKVVVPGDLPLVKNGCFHCDGKVG